MTLTDVLKLQRLLQERYAAERGMANPVELKTQGEWLDYCKEMQHFLNSEIQELMEAATTTSCRKPWKEDHLRHRRWEVELNHEVKHEAIDMLCFCMNLLLAAGVDETNLEVLYREVQQKNITRLEQGY